MVIFSRMWIHSFLLTCSILVLAAIPSMTRDFRVDMIPHGNLLSCNACHVFPSGPRNEFGIAVEQLVTPDGQEVFWGTELAALDSDLDGFTNGEELQDPLGDWKAGDPYPGNPELVSFPGDPLSVPAQLPEEPLEIFLEEVVTGLSSPVTGAHAEDGTDRLFIVEQWGRIRVIQNGTLLEEPFLDISSKLVRINASYDERGLLGIAFHPRYEENGRFFIYYSAPTNRDNHKSLLVEYRVSPDNPNLADPESERLLLEILQPESNHNGGQLAFGPDNLLYIGLGDGGGAGDQHGTIGNGQSLDTLLGKILRINVDADEPYSIPSDNPFVGDPAVLPEIWAYGFRNPWKFSFDRATSRLFCGDVGQNRWEEINIVEKGGNYGWRVMEGAHCFNPPRDCDTSGKILPIAEYNHSLGRSITGGYVYRGVAYPSLVGKYVFGDWDNRLFYLIENTDGSWTMEEFIIENKPASLYVLSFMEDEAGEIYVLSSVTSGPGGGSDSVYKITVPSDVVGVPDFQKYD